MNIIHVPYDRGFMEMDLTKLNVAAILEPRQQGAGGDILSPGQLVSRALEQPIGTKRLRDLARDKRNIVVVTSDHTRPMPSRITLPLLLSEIREFNKGAEVTILIATGLHRATTPEELLERFGSAIVDGERIVIHDALKDKCVYMGQLPSGNDYAVNKLVLDADLLVCEGYIEPHFFAGFSGGRKSILPGVCSAETIRANHSSRTIANPYSAAGVLEDNPIHLDALHAARSVGVDFILNVALDQNKRVVGAFAGDLEAAHAEGCALVAQLFTIPRVPADIVVTSNGGYPLDQNLYQCAKAVRTAAECVKAGGIIILVASCTDGIGAKEFEMLMLEGNPGRTLAKLMSLSDQDTIIDQWCAQIFFQVMVQHEIFVVTEHLDHGLLRSMGLTPASTIDEAIAVALQKKGSRASVTVIPDGVSVIVEQKEQQGF
jgi:nickel-dependent lactate racemase